MNRYAATTGRDELYEYDNLHRLVDTQRGELNGNKDAINSLAFRQNWGLDGLGNWDAFNEDANGNSTWDLEQTRDHNLANEIDTIGATTGPVWVDPDHDAAGNMSTMPQPYDLTESYTAVYDAWNRLVKLVDDDTSNTRAEYGYDGQNRRIVSKTYDAIGSLDHTRHFYYSQQWQVLEERVDGTAAGDVERQFVWGFEYVDKMVVRYRDTTGNGTLDETLYVVCDTNYRITAIVDATGSVVERYTYSPYGQRTVLNDDWSLHADATFGSHEFRYGHQGLRHDPETGLVYNRNRYLHVTLGRFVQRDPINQNLPGGGYQDGMNLYQYIRAMPIVHLDPHGTIVIIPPSIFPTFPCTVGDTETRRPELTRRENCDCDAEDPIGGEYTITVGTTVSASIHGVGVSATVEAADTLTYTVNPGRIGIVYGILDCECKKSSWIWIGITGEFSYWSCSFAGLGVRYRDCS